MNHTIVKICGITRVEDGLAALTAGADWLGFIRWDGSKRFRPLEDCAATLQAIRTESDQEFQAVGVYVDATREAIESEIRVARFDRVQLHGDEPPALIESLDVPAIKTIKIADEASVALAEQYPGVDLLTDTPDALLPGGTGRGYDRSLLESLVSRRRVVVAGGLTPENVGEVVARLRPYGVDVSTAVEISPGVKDRAKIDAFLQAVRGAERQWVAGGSVDPPARGPD